MRGTISLPSVLSLPRAVLLLAATILPAVLAANAWASGAQAPAVYTWPPNATSPPYILLVNVGGGNVSLSYTLETSVTAAAEPVHAPACNGSTLVVLDAYYNGEPAAGGVVVVYSELARSFCVARLFGNGKAYFSLDPGIYKMYVLSGRRAAGYTLVGRTELTFWCTCSRPYVRVDLQPLAALLGLNESTTASARLRAPVVEGYAVAPVPFISCGSGWSASGISAGLPFARTVTVTASFKLVLKVEVDGSTILERAFTYTSTPSSTRERPAAIALLPPGHSPVMVASANSTVEVRVLAFTYGDATLALLYSVNGGGWTESALVEDNASIEYSRIVDSLEHLAESSLERLEPIVRGSFNLDFRAPSFKAGYHAFRLPGPGTAIAYYAVLRAGDTVYATPTALILSVNSSGEPALVYDPAVAAWLAARYHEGCEGLPVPFAEACSRGFAVVKAMRANPLSQLVEWPHWESLASRYNVVLAVTPAEALEALEKAKPKLIVLGDVALTYSPQWPLLVEKLYRYVEESGAGLLALHSSIASIQVDLASKPPRLAYYSPKPLWMLLGLKGLLLERNATVLPWAPCTVNLTVEGMHVEGEALCSVGWQLAAPWTLNPRAMELLRGVGRWSVASNFEGYTEAARSLAAMLEKARERLVSGSTALGGWASLLYELALRKPLKTFCGGYGCCIVLYNGLLEGRRYRAVYVSFTLERLDSPGARRLLLKLADWAARGAGLPAWRTPAQVLSKLKGEGLNVLYSVARLVAGKGSIVGFAECGKGPLYVIVDVAGNATVTVVAPQLGLSGQVRGEGPTVYRAQVPEATALWVRVRYTAEKPSLLLVAVVGVEYRPRVEGLARLLTVKPIIGLIVCRLPLRAGLLWVS